jgi:2-iminobutanoate/2-iminopropanoate deaminase
MTQLLRALLLILPLAACRSHPPQVRHLEAEGAFGPWSGSVLWGGSCFASGQLGERGASFAREADTAISALQTELGRSGLGLGDVVSCTVYLTDMAYYGEFNEIYAQRFPRPYPARACVAVKELPANARVEIQAIARRNAKD